MTSKEGFSVVAPIKIIVPASTCGRRASCWDLLKRWISSINNTVRFCSFAKRSFASVTTFRTSASVAVTALFRSTCAPVSSAQRYARVVFPDPGGPQNTNEGRNWEARSFRNIPSGPTRCACPTTSSSDLGRRSSASGRDSILFLRA